MVGNRYIVARESLQVAKLVVISSEQEHFKISEYPFMCGFSCSSVKFSEKHDSPQAAEIEVGRLKCSVRRILIMNVTVSWPKSTNEFKVPAL